jgi:hypothetical protein
MEKLAKTYIKKNCQLFHRSFNPPDIHNNLKEIDESPPLPSSAVGRFILLNVYK